MGILNIANEIENKIKLLENMRVEIRNRAEKKAETLANYDKVISVTIIKLKNGEAFEFEGHTVKDPVNTIIDKIARGICWKEKQEMELSEALYKALITNIDCVSVQINALQSINRYLDKT
jgi:hypothetical protein